MTEAFVALIQVLHEHSHRQNGLLDLQIVVIIGIIGYILSNPRVIDNRRFKLLLTTAFLIFLSYSLISTHITQTRKEQLWEALHARVAAKEHMFLPEERAYVVSLEPTPMGWKFVGLLTADLIVIMTIWIKPSKED